MNGLVFCRVKLPQPTCRWCQISSNLFSINGSGHQQWSPAL